MFLTHPITRPQRIITGKLESLIGVSFAVGARRHDQPSAAAGASRSFYSTAPVNPFPAANPSTSNLVRGCDPAVGCFSLSASNLTPINNSFHTTTPSRFSIRSNSLSKMAATKDYRLLCLENPLLGESYSSPPVSSCLHLSWRLSNFSGSSGASRFSILPIRLATPRRNPSSSLVRKTCMMQVSCS